MKKAAELRLPFKLPLLSGTSESLPPSSYR